MSTSERIFYALTAYTRELVRANTSGTMVFEEVNKAAQALHAELAALDKLDMLDARMPKEGQLRIVCAANRWDGYSVLGVRHNDAVMREGYHQLCQASPVSPPIFSEWEEGFMDNRGFWHDRTSAWKVAKAAGQILFRCGGDETNGGTLYSENLY